MPKIKRRGWFCRICCRCRPNEAFSGKGRQIHICKQCRQRPAIEIKEIIEMDELQRYFEQSNISKKNLKRLKELSASEIPNIKSLAELILKIGQVKPSRRKRLVFLKKNYPELWVKLMKVGLISYAEYFDEGEKQDDIINKIFDFENLCEYIDFNEDNYNESEFEIEKINNNECPF